MENGILTFFFVWTLIFNKAIDLKLYIYIFSKNRVMQPVLP